MNAITFLGTRSRPLLTVIGFLAIPLFGIIDYVTGPQLSFSIFYLVPISVVTLFSGGKAGVLASVASSIAWLAADMLWQVPYVHPAIPYWNAAVRLGFFSLGVILLRTLRLENERLEVTVQERTAALTQEIAEHERAEKRIQAHVNRLAALRSIDMAITASLDLRVTLNVFLDQMLSLLQVDAAAVLLADSQTHTLNYSSGRGFSTMALQHTHLRFGQGHAGRAALERCIISVPHLDENPNDLKRAPQLAREEFVAYLAVPLIAKGYVKGVLEVFHRAALDTDQEWMDDLETLACQAAIAIDNASLFNNLHQSNIALVLAYDTTLEGWSHALDLRDKETEGHTLRVTEMTLRLARAMGVGDEALVHVRRGGLLHDIGKMGIPDSILLKAGPLTEAEWGMMRKHPVMAKELLSPITYLRPALDIPYCHHEKWDGSGYPRGLKGDEIPLAARLFAVVDVWDALSFDRPYRKAWSHEKIIQHIRERAGTHFDPKAVESFLQILSRDE